MDGTILKSVCIRNIYVDDDFLFFQMQILTYYVQPNVLTPNQYYPQECVMSP